MPRLAPKSIELEPAEEEEIAKILARHSTSQQIALRAKIIILASKGKNNRAIARELDISRKMARLWRDRWRSAFAQIDRRLRRLGSGASALKQKDVPVVERLADAQRPRKPTQFTQPNRYYNYLRCDGKSRLTAFGGTGADAPRESPEKYGRPISHWTSTELAQEMIEQEIVASISPRHVGRLLSEASLKPHCSVTVHSPSKKAIAFFAQALIKRE